MGSHSLAVLVVTPAGLQKSMSTKVLVVVFFLVADINAARQLRGPKERDQRSLVTTFPFNSNSENLLHAVAAHEEYEPNFSESLDNRSARQGNEGESVSFADVAGASPGADAKKCIDKVEMVEETEYDDVVQCDHSYDKRCHTTYVTNFESQQEEECEENFRKNCFIEYEQIAFNETVNVCRTPLVKDCDQTGEEICRTEYESECWTKQEVHDVEDDVVDVKQRLRKNVKMKHLDTLSWHGGCGCGGSSCSSGAALLMA